MKIAVTYDNGNVFQHFGHTEAFKVYDIEDSKIKSSEVVPTNGSGHGALAGFLKDLGASTLIGGGAQMALSEAEIELYAGIVGNCDEAVVAFISGTLAHNTEANCNHHHEHSEGHSCGGHCHE